MNSSRLIKNFLIKLIPSKEVFVVCILFYMVGIVFAFMNPDQAHITFPAGMFLDNMEAKIQMPGVITFNYILNQFVYYLGAVSLSIFLNNLVLMTSCIFSGIAILPVILIGLFMKMGAISFLTVNKLGFTGILVILGSFHIYFEFLAALLAIETFYKFYISLINSIRKKDLTIIKKCILNEFIPLFIKIALLLALAALLEVFWSTWWIYILTHPYISWHDFYFGAYSVLLNR